jgi:putative ABC transport system permease protein
MLSDLRFVLRVLSRSRGFTSVVVLTLALGIGSAASIFSVTDYVLFQGTKYPEDVFLIGGQSVQNGFQSGRFDFMARAYSEQTDVVSAFAKSTYRSGNVVVNGEPVATSWLGVSANFLQLLNITPALGRGFMPGEDSEGADHVIIVAHQFWQKHLGGKKDVLGSQLIVGDAVCTVVGVLRPGQRMPGFFWGEVFRPLTYRVDPKNPWNPYLNILGKLRPGVTREQATAALENTKPDLPPQMKNFLNQERPALAALSEADKYMRPEVYWMLLAAVGFLYAIACLNASNLMLVRMLGQRRELSIRLALGCGRARLIRLLAMESIALAFLGALGGLLVANWFFPLLLNAAGSSNFKPDWTAWNVSWRVATLLGILAVVTSAVIVAVPALRVLRTQINAGLKDGGAALGESPALARLRGLFVILQAAFAVILLAGAGLMIRTFQRVQQLDVGFEQTGRAKIMLAFPDDYPNGAEVRLARLREVQEHLQHVPGVSDAAFGMDFLLPGYFMMTSTMKAADGSSMNVQWANFSVGFNEVAGLRLKAGRWLKPGVGNEVMVSESLARTRWPHESALGQLIEPTEKNTNASADWKGWLVVGVMGDVRASVREAPGKYMICPESWNPQVMSTFVVRLSRDFDESFAGSLRRDLFAFDPRIIVHQILPLSALREQQLWTEKLANSVLKVLAGIALVLTVVGIFSVLAYTVDRRMPEFGVRMALGATRWDLMQHVLRRGVLLTAAGVVLGIASAMALTRFLQSLLFETSPQDPWVLTAVGFILLVTSVLACVVPAQRATKVDITRLLRSE